VDPFPEPEACCPVVHDDLRLLVVAKPSGLLSHPNRTGERAAFTGAYDAVARCFSNAGSRLWLVHRLDQDTSGLLLAARDEAAAVHCRACFEDGRVEKTYVSLTGGRAPRRGVWRDRLEESRRGAAVRARVVAGPATAEARFERLGVPQSMDLSLLAIRLVTGRTHQIRVQAAARALPVLGDDVYGDFALNRWARRELGLRRLFLHAAGLVLPHPDGGELRLKLALPSDLASSLVRLGLASV
jgi:23S rRNA-/tRNA-specific pseudouridylate synthase